MAVAAARRSLALTWTGCSHAPRSGSRWTVTSASQYGDRRGAVEGADANVLHPQRSTPVAVRAHPHVDHLGHPVPHLHHDLLRKAFVGGTPVHHLLGDAAVADLFVAGAVDEFAAVAQHLGRDDAGRAGVFRFSRSTGAMFAQPANRLPR